MVETENITSLLEEVNDRLRDMEARIHTLEARLGEAVKQPAAAKNVAEERIDPEILMVIAAAVAAFMGRKAHIRRVRRSVAPGMNPWAQQGRVTIQASHNAGWAR
jgi:methylmalonyl-CoA carboxyltransferase 12S subunit